MGAHGWLGRIWGTLGRLLRESLWHLYQEFHHHKRPTYVIIALVETHGHHHHHHRKEFSMADFQINVNETKSFIVRVLDQDRNPIAFDFSANPPSWSTDQPSNLGLAAGATLETENVTGLAATTTDANLSVSVSGVVNPTDTKTVQVVAVVPPPVATFVEIVPA